MRYFYFLLAMSVSVSEAEGTMTARVRCHDYQEVYIDGEYQKLGYHSTDWSRELGDDTKLLAIECQNVRGFGGLLVSFADVLISDSTWKCSDTLIDNWYGMDFDDGEWKNAHVLGGSGTSFIHGIEGFKEYSQWIWYDDNNREPSRQVFCRGRTGVILHAYCNGKCDVYADEELIAREVGNIPGRFWSGTIPRTTRVISVDGENTDDAQGLVVVSTSTGFNSNVQWKCSGQNPAGWTAIDYDDTTWTSAIDQRRPTSGRSAIPDLFRGATPIWFELRPHGEGTWSRCRGRIECGCDHTCDVNGDEFTCRCEKGYFLTDDGRTCRDIDECTKELLRDCEECINLPGAYTCECKHGFTLGDDGRNCTDIDECITGDHNCTGVFECDNTIGSYHCLCPSGYTQGDRMTEEVCVDVNECDRSNGDCDHVCENTNGSYYCMCDDGYLLQDDGRTCSSGLPVAVISGAAVGIVVVVASLVAVALLLLRRYLSSKKTAALNKENPAEELKLDGEETLVGVDKNKTESTDEHPYAEISELQEDTRYENAAETTLSTYYEDVDDINDINQPVEGPYESLPERSEYVNSGVCPYECLRPGNN